MKKPPNLAIIVLYCIVIYIYKKRVVLLGIILPVCAAALSTMLHKNS